MKNLLHFFVTLMLSFVAIQGLTQEKKITLDDIWNSRIFVPDNVFGMNPLNDGKTYAAIEKGNLVVYDFVSGKKLRTLVNATDLTPANSETNLPLRSYIFNFDETKLLFPTETEAIYRHSTRSNYWLFDLTTNTLEPLSTNGKQQLATFSPDGKKIAFVRENNIFIKYIDSKEEIQITHDGDINKIINGTTDWVYEEEFGFTKAFFWSPDSKKIAFYRFDESNVKEFQMALYGELYPQQYKFRYPKAGEDNSLISIWIWNENTDKTNQVDIGSDLDIYIPRIGWTQDKNILWFQRLNRHQNHFELLFADAATGQSKTIYEEKNPYYVDINDDLTFLPDGKHFYITSEKEGYNQLYLFDIDGKLVRKLTDTNWDITKIYGFDIKNNKIFFQAANIDPMNRSILSVDLKGKITSILEIPGDNDATFSKNYSLFVNRNTTINTPYIIGVYNNKGKLLREMINNAELMERMKEYEFSNFEFFQIEDDAFMLPSGSNVKLNAWKLLPHDFDPNKKYPVLMYVYGGPGSQTVQNKWGGSNHLWFQMLAQQGFIVVSVDNRGTGARGQEFKKMTYLELGKYETEDLISSAKFLSELPYVRKESIGIFGWSYGGYMSSLAITKGANDFSAAIAVAPVTNWRFYDNIYTERYMRKPVENESGYDNNSPINHVDKLTGKYLLVHGSADDNVHYQNAIEMTSALIKANKQFDLMIYPDRNHGIYGYNARPHLYELMTRFLHQSLNQD